MPFPLSMTVTMSRYLLTRKLRGEEKFPLVMMLEPLHACNLTCTGCASPRASPSFGAVSSWPPWWRSSAVPTTPTATAS